MMAAPTAAAISPDDQAAVGCGRGGGGRRGCGRRWCPRLCHGGCRLADAFDAPGPAFSVSAPGRQRAQPGETQVTGPVNDGLGAGGASGSYSCRADLAILGRAKGGLQPFRAARYAAVHRRIKGHRVQPSGKIIAPHGVPEIAPIDFGRAGARHGLDVLAGIAGLADAHVRVPAGVMRVIHIAALVAEKLGQAGIEIGFHGRSNEKGPRAGGPSWGDFWGWSVQPVKRHRHAQSEGHADDERPQGAAHHGPRIKPCHLAASPRECGSAMPRRWPRPGCR